jgi:hypothetical protein
MTWVLGNLDNCAPDETFSNSLRTPAPVTGLSVDGHIDASNEDDDAADEEWGTLPRTLEAWIDAQKNDPAMQAMLEGIEHKACQQDLWIRALPNVSPTIIVPPAQQEALTRSVHEQMFHLNQAKVSAVFHRSYFWAGMRKDIR